jgi:hypothetical protein
MKRVTLGKSKTLVMTLAALLLHIAFKISKEKQKPHWSQASNWVFN